MNRDPHYNFLTTVWKTPFLPISETPTDQYDTVILLDLNVLKRLQVCSQIIILNCHFFLIQHFYYVLADFAIVGHTNMAIAPFIEASSEQSGKS